MAAMTSVHGTAPGLIGISGKLRLQLADSPAGVLEVAPNGEIGIVSEGEASTVLEVDTTDTLNALLRGDLNPIVARLQNRVRVEGDVALVLRVFLGLQAGSPWNVATPRS
jgi:hypothetical protein